MSTKIFSRIPKHIGVIPDGNRRWAEARGMEKQRGYDFGLGPGLRVLDLCLELGVQELTFYGFTQDNTKRPAIQTIAFQKACVDAVKLLASRDAELLVVGNHTSPLFPKELRPFLTRQSFGRGLIKVNFLVNYGWHWDLSHGLTQGVTMKKPLASSGAFFDSIASADISRIDLIVRWGGRRRLSGFLPAQTIYSDFYILDDYWPDFEDKHLYEALQWYQHQDVTLGG